MRKEKDNNAAGALYWILQQTEFLLEVSAKTRQFTIPKDRNVILDWGGFKDKEAPKTFYAEWVFRQLWAQIARGERPFSIICVDEADRLTNNSFGDFKTILYEMLARGRQYCWLWAVTHNFHDINDDVRSLFDTQLLFATNSKEDLDALAAIDVKLSWTASRMPKYMFTDARFPNLAHAPFLPLWMKVPIKEKYKHETAREATRKPTEQQPPTSPAAKEEPPKLEIIRREDDALKKPDWLAEVTEKIEKASEENTVTYLTEMSKELAEKYGIKVNEAKIRTNLALKQLRENESATYAWEAVQRHVYEVPRVMYWKRKQNESPFHSYLVEEVLKEIPKQEPKMTVLDTAISGQVSKADIETDLVLFEIETGLQHDKTKLTERLRRASKPTIIIVPNQKVKEDYNWVVENYPKGQVMLMMLGEFSDKNVHAAKIKRKGP